jgi:hypothetical protein
MISGERRPLLLDHLPRKYRKNQPGLALLAPTLNAPPVALVNQYRVLLTVKLTLPMMAAREIQVPLQGRVL